MKKILIICLLSFCVVGCGDSSLDGKLVKDADGNIYELTHNVGYTYFITKIDMEKYKDIDVGNLCLNSRDGGAVPV